MSIFRKYDAVSQSIQARSLSCWQRYRRRLLLLILSLLPLTALLLSAFISCRPKLDKQDVDTVLYVQDCLPVCIPRIQEVNPKWNEYFTYFIAIKMWNLLYHLSVTIYFNKIKHRLMISSLLIIPYFFTHKPSDFFIIWHKFGRFFARNGARLIAVGLGFQINCWIR